MKCKCSPFYCKCNFILIFIIYLDLVESRETINYRKITCNNNIIQDMLHRRESVIIFQGNLVHIFEINIEFDFSIFLPYWDQISYPSRVLNEIYYLGIKMLKQLLLHGFLNPQVHQPLFMPIWLGIRHEINGMLDHIFITSIQIIISPCNYL